MYNPEPLQFSKSRLGSLIVFFLFIAASCGGSKKEVTIGLTRDELERFLQVNNYVKRDELKDFLTWEHIISALRDPKSQLYQELTVLGERDIATTVSLIESSLKNPASNASQSIRALFDLSDSVIKEVKEILLLHKFISQLKKLSDLTNPEARILEEFLKELGPGKGRLLGLFGETLQGENDALSVANLKSATLDRLCFLIAIFARCDTYVRQEAAIELLFETERPNLVGAIHGIEPINKNSVHEAFCKREGVASTLGPTLDKVFVYRNIVYKCSLTGTAGIAKMVQLKADGTGFDTEVVLGGVA